jgi:hypothetical protein
LEARQGLSPFSLKADQRAELLHELLEAAVKKPA